jgi:hypothetical protein
MLYNVIQRKRYVALCCIVLLHKGKRRTFETQPRYDLLVDYLITLYLHSSYIVSNT